MTLYAERLAKRSRLLAQLIERLVKDRVGTYQQIAKWTGVSRNVLIHFVQTGGATAKSDAIPAIKTENLIRILEWFEKSNFQNSQFNGTHQSIAAEIKETFQHEHSDKIFSTFTQGFRLNSEALIRLSRHFNGTFIAVRRRGKSKHYQVSALRFFDLAGSQYLQWKQFFLDREQPVQKEGQKPPGQAALHIAEGYVGNHERFNNCLGRRRKTNAICMINIIANLDDAPRERYFSLYSTYSHSEAIARSMILIRREDLDDLDNSELYNHIGDKEDSELEGVFDDGLTRMDLGHRISVQDNEFIGHRELLDQLDGLT